MQQIQKMMKINNGIIAVNKDKSWTSFDVVNKIKHFVYPNKVGHLGTLDPMATGVLLVTIGKATKLFDIMQEKNKTYLAKFKFGYLTDTLDAEGEIVKTTNIIPSIEDIDNAIKQFIGYIDQVPPKYSAKNINGKRAYDLARINKEFTLPPKRVYIEDIEILSFIDNELTLKIKCGSGTYVRSLARDLGEKTNSLATMTELCRTDIDRFNIKDCCKVNDLTKENISEFILPIEKILNYNEITFDKDDTLHILNGMTVLTSINDGNYLLKDNGNVVAIVKVTNNHAKMSIFLG